MKAAVLYNKGGAPKYVDKSRAKGTHYSTEGSQVEGHVTDYNTGGTDSWVAG